mgnify:CR=1 FL=1
MQTRFCSLQTVTKKEIIMNGYLKGLQTAWNNTAVRNTIAGAFGFVVGRVYPAVKSTAEKGIKTLKEKWEKEDAPAEQPEPSEEG